MSYAPFHGGRRICIGKTFAENVSKSAVAIFFHMFKDLNLEFVDKKNYETLTRINVFLTADPVVLLQAKAK